MEVLFGAVALARRLAFPIPTPLIVVVVVQAVVALPLCCKSAVRLLCCEDLGAERFADSIGL